MAFRVLNLSAVAANMGRCMSTSSSTVGFIGLGQMGNRMATNLINKGYKLNVYDVSAEACDAMKSKGAQVFKSTQELAKQSKYVITMLPNNDIVKATYEDMIKDGVNSETMFVDSSTVSPDVSQYIQKIIKAKGASFVDAPVSGGVMGAQNATLTFMVGGTSDEFERVKGFLEGMGKKITHCGSIGMGEAAKLCNNMMLGISMIGTAETMNLAIRLGLDPKVFNEIINCSTGRSWASEINNPVPGVVPTAPPSNEYKGGFSTALITKDLGLASAVATASNSPIALGALSHQIYRTMMAKGLGNKDFSVIYDFIKNDSSKK
ncbi:unnamed protein product [Diamesa serratosioi]